MRSLFAGLAFFLAACGPVSSPEHRRPAIAAEAAWATPTPGGVTVSAGYLSIVNDGPADRLVSVASPRAARVELHEMALEGNVTRMRQLDGLDIPANGAVQLAPGGRHLMFIDAAPPFAEGEEVPVTLTFENAGALEVAMPVRRPSH